MGGGWRGDGGGCDREKVEPARRRSELSVVFFFSFSVTPRPYDKNDKTLHVHVRLRTKLQCR